MIYVEDGKTIHITRGDKTDGTYNKLAFQAFYYDIASGEMKNYVFSPDDKISFVVIRKKGYTKREILRKEYTLKELGHTTSTITAEIPLSSIETKNFELSNKPITYWYEITLNDNITIVGYDSDGAPKLIAYPEVGETN